MWINNDIECVHNKRNNWKTNEIIIHFYRFKATLHAIKENIYFRSSHLTRIRFIIISNKCDKRDTICTFDTSLYVYLVWCTLIFFYCACDLIFLNFSFVLAIFRFHFKQIYSFQLNIKSINSTSTKRSNIPGIDYHVIDTLLPLTKLVSNFKFSRWVWIILNSCDICCTTDTFLA